MGLLLFLGSSFAFRREKSLTSNLPIFEAQLTLNLFYFVNNVFLRGVAFKSYPAKKNISMRDLPWISQHPSKIFPQ
jgi:hypothetical protein